MNRIRHTEIVTIKQFILMETGTYNDQFLRSYRIGADHNTINFIAEKVASKRGGDVSSSEISEISHHVITPSTEVTGKVDIDHGWSTKRYSFYLVLEYRSSDLSNVRTIETIIGYTDFKDSINDVRDKNNQINFINPDTKFYITAINTTRSSVIDKGTNTVNDIRSIQRRQVLMNNGFKISDNNFNPINTVLASPSNVFNRLATASLMGDYNDNSIGNKEINNTIGNITSYIPEYNDRNNNSSSTYLATLLNSFKSSKNDNDVNNGNAIGVPIEDTYNDAFNKVNDNYYNTSGNNNDYLQSFHNSPVIMNKINMIEGGVNRNSFRLKTLDQIDPNYRSIATVVNDYSRNMGLSIRGQSQNWNSTDPNTMFAVTLAHAIPTYMLKCLLSYLSFTVSNQNIENRVDFIVGVDAKSYTQRGDITYLINAFKSSLLSDVIKGYTQDFKCGFFIKCTVNVLLEISLEVSINGLPITPYITPAFSDNLIAPTITTSDGLVTLISELNGLFTELDYNINLTNEYVNRVVPINNNIPSVDYDTINARNYNL